MTKKIRINKYKLMEYKNDLEVYPDYIPIFFYKYINVTNRHNFIKQLKNYDNIHRKIAEYKRNINLSDNPLDYNLNEVKDWCRENKKFKDIII